MRELQSLSFCYDRKLLFLLVAINTDNNFNYGYPLLRMVDASNKELRTLSDADMVEVLSRAYELNPDKPLVPNVNLHERDIDYTISQLRSQIVEDIVRKHRGIFDKEFKEEHSLNHYDCYDVPERRNVALELSSAEENEVNRLMHIILKKIYYLDSSQIAINETLISHINYCLFCLYPYEQLGARIGE